MTIQDNSSPNRKLDGYHSEPDQHDSWSGELKDTIQNESKPIVTDKITPLDFTEVERIQKEIVLKQSSSDSIIESDSLIRSLSRRFLKSPRAVLRERRDKLANQKLYKEDQKHFVEQLLQKCPSRDQIGSSNQPISLETMSNCKFNLDEFYTLKLVKRSRSKSFNKQFLGVLQTTIKSAHVQEIDDRFINDYVSASVIREVDSFLNRIDDPLSLKYSDLEKCCPIIANKIYAQLCRQDCLYTFVRRNFLFLRIKIGETLKSLKCGSRSEFLVKIVEALEFVINAEPFAIQKYKIDKDVVESLQFYDLFINNIVEDLTIRSLLLSVIHPDEEEAVKTLKQLSFWGTDEGCCLMVSQIRKAMHLYLKHLQVRKKTTTFKEHFLCGKNLVDVDFTQVARSYIMYSERIYNKLEVNEQDINVDNIKGTSKLICQEQFFQVFLKVLYESGLLQKTTDEFVLGEVEKFLNNEKFEGQEILVAGSNSAWAICDMKLRSMFPLLFNETYKTRMNQGTECFVQVHSRDKFSVLVNRTYTTFPLPPGVKSKNSFAIDPSRPLCNVQVCWQVDYDVKQGWSHTISTPQVQRKKASGEEWEELLDILLAPKFDETLSPEYPENEQLKNALQILE